MSEKSKQYPPGLAREVNRLNNTPHLVRPTPEEMEVCTVYLDGSEEEMSGCYRVGLANLEKFPTFYRNKPVARVVEEAKEVVCAQRSHCPVYEHAGDRRQELPCSVTFAILRNFLDNRK